MTVHLVEAEVCESGLCQIGHLLVRGDRVSFVSDEQAKKSGAKRTVRDGRVYWDPEAPKSDVKSIPPGYVVVHDATGTLLSSCDMYIVRFISTTSGQDEISAEAISAAREYYGKNVRIKVGQVELPEGPWKRISGKMNMVRYRRAGDLADSYEHVWDPSVSLYDCENPIAWRMPLPEGCIVDPRGFVRP